MSDNNDNKPEDPTRLRIEDPDNEFHQRHAKAIQEAQEEIGQIEFRAVGYDKPVRNLAIYRSVAKLCKRAEPLFLKTQRGLNYWKNADVGGFVESPPQHATRQQQRDNHRIPTTATNARLEPKRISISSLEEFVAIDPEYTFRFVYGKTVGTRVDTNEYTTSRILPARISNKAHRITNRYLSDIGLGVKLEPEPHTGDGPNANNMMGETYE